MPISWQLTIYEPIPFQNLLRSSTANYFYNNQLLFSRVLVEGNDDFVLVPEGESQFWVEVESVCVVPAPARRHTSLPPPVVKTETPGRLPTQGRLISGCVRVQMHRLK